MGVRAGDGLRGWGRVRGAGPAHALPACNHGCQPGAPLPPPAAGVQERRLLPGPPGVDAGGARGAARHAGQPERPAGGGHFSRPRPAGQAGGLGFFPRGRRQLPGPRCGAHARPARPPRPRRLSPPPGRPRSLPCIRPARQVRAAIDAAPHLSLDAQRLGLVDARLYRDQAVKLLGRLQEARQPDAQAPAVAPAMPVTGATASGERPQASGKPPQGLLPRLLADPDAGGCGQWGAAEAGPRCWGKVAARPPSTAPCLCHARKPPPSSRFWPASPPAWPWPGRPCHHPAAPPRWLPPAHASLLQSRLGL